jgi:hypothetical protein
MKTLKQFLFYISIACFQTIALGQCATPPTDMVSWWQAENNANDVYGNNNGIEQNGIGYVSGAVNNAFYCDGIDDIIVVPHHSNLDITGDVTLELWVKQTGFDNDIQTVLCKGSGTLTNNQPAVFTMRFEIATLIFSFMDISGANIELIGPSFEDFQWHHYAYVRQGNQHMIYADGFDFGWEPFVNSADSSINLPLTIGAQYYSETDNYNDFFAGEVDEISVYNRALSAAEIQSIYNAGVLGKCADELSLEELELSQNDVKIFPNPVIDEVIIKIDEHLINNHKDLRLSVMDLSGRIVSRDIELHSTTKINVSTFSKGMYLYTISNSVSIIKTGQLIKK